MSQEFTPFPPGLPFRGNELPSEVTRYLEDQAIQLRDFAEKATSGGLTLPEEVLTQRYLTKSVTPGAIATIERGTLPSAKARFVGFDPQNGGSTRLMSAPLSIGPELVRNTIGDNPALEFLGINFSTQEPNSGYGWIGCAGLYLLESTEFETGFAGGLCAPKIGGQFELATDLAVGIRLANTNYVFLFGYCIAVTPELSDYVAQFESISARLAQIELAQLVQQQQAAAEFQSLSNQVTSIEQSLVRVEGLGQQVAVLNTQVQQANQFLSVAADATQLIASINYGLDQLEASITQTRTALTSMQGAIAEQETTLATQNGQVQIIAGVAQTVTEKTRAYLGLEVSADGTTAAARLQADAFGSSIDLIADRIRLGSSDEIAMEIVDGDVTFLGSVTANSIKTEHLDFNAVTGEKVAPEAITATNIVLDSLGIDTVAAANVSDIVATTVTASKAALQLGSNNTTFKTPFNYVNPGFYSPLFVDLYLEVINRTLSTSPALHWLFEIHPYTGVWGAAGFSIDYATVLGNNAGVVTIPGPQNTTYPFTTRIFENITPFGPSGLDTGKYCLAWYPYYPDSTGPADRFTINRLTNYVFTSFINS